MIAKITRAYVRHYHDNGQITAYVEWVDHRGQTGRTEGTPPGKPCRECGQPHPSTHIAALFARAQDEGLTIEWVG